MRSLSIAALCCAFATTVSGLAAAAPAAPAAAPAAADVAPAADAAADPVGAHAAIAQAQERLAEIDATITVMQAEADHADAAVRQRAHDAVTGLKTIRDTYKKELDGIVAHGRAMTAAQLAVARTALTAPWTQFEQTLDGDVAAIKLGVAARKEIVAARIRAEQDYWQSVIADLRRSATDLSAEQRAAIDARIARITTRAADARARLDRVTVAGQGAWTALKRGLVNSRQVFEDTYRDGR